MANGPKEMNMNRLRPYTAVTMALTFVFIGLTGLILFLAPEGPTGRGWHWLGLSKHQYKDIHLYLGALAVVLVSFHTYLNNRPLLHYLNQTTRGWKHPLVWATLLLLTFMGTALFLSAPHFR